VIGTDAGPFTGAWAFKDNGGRAGRVSTDADALNILDVLRGAKRNSELCRFPA
jgi:hypothetical protein